MNKGLRNESSCWAHSKRNHKVRKNEGGGSVYHLTCYTKIHNHKSYRNGCGMLVCMLGKGPELCPLQGSSTWGRSCRRQWSANNRDPVQKPKLVKNIILDLTWQTQKESVEGACASALCQARPVRTPPAAHSIGTSTGWRLCCYERGDCSSKTSRNLTEAKCQKAWSQPEATSHSELLRWPRYLQWAPYKS